MDLVANMISIAKLLALVLLAAKIFRLVKGKRLLAAVFARSSAQAGVAPQTATNPFALDFPLLKFTPYDTFTLGNAFEGIHVFGANGSGKTSGPCAGLIKALMRAGAGFLVMTAKKGEYERFQQYAEETGRTKSLKRFAPEEPHRFNFMSYLAKVSSRGGVLTENIVATLITIQETLERTGNSGDRDPFWKDTLMQGLRNSVDLCLIARPGQAISVQMLHEVMMTAPTSLAQIDDPAWQNTLCSQLFEEALSRKDALDDRTRSDLKITAGYFTTEYPQLPADTRGSILATLSAMTDIFLRGTMATLFGTDLNIVPEMMWFEGAIIVIDLSAKEFGKAGIAAQNLWRHIAEDAIERRDITVNSRPVCVALDESHLFADIAKLLSGTRRRDQRQGVDRGTPWGLATENLLSKF
jgi:hypothetical protein